MRILAISTYYGEAEGGADISTKLLVKGLSSLDNEVIVVSINPQQKEGIHSILNYSPLSTPIIAFLLNTKLLDNFLVSRIDDLIKKTKPSIIHVHDIMLLPASVKAAKKNNIPCLVTVRDLRFVTNVPILSMADLSLDFSSKSVFLRYLAKQKGWISSLIVLPFVFNRSRDLRKALRLADSIVAISKFVKKQLIACGIDKNIDVIYNPMPEWKDMKVSRIPEDAGRVIFFAPGRLEYYKGFHLLIEAMHKIVELGEKRIKLYIAGIGPYENKLKQMVSNYGLENYVVFSGKLGYGDIKRSYFMCDCVLFPSIWPEALGRIPLEAMAAGKPCIASDVGGISELVDTKYLVKPDSEEFAKAMKKFVIANLK